MYSSAVRLLRQDICSIELEYFTLITNVLPVPGDVPANSGLYTYVK